MKVLDSSGLWYMAELMGNNFNNIKQQIAQGDVNVLDYVNGSFRSGLLTTKDASVYLKKNNDTATSLTVNTLTNTNVQVINRQNGRGSWSWPNISIISGNETAQNYTIYSPVLIANTSNVWGMGINGKGFTLGKLKQNESRVDYIHSLFEVDNSGNIYENQEALKDKYALKTDLNSYVQKTDISTAIADIVNAAPETLNTLDELAAALGDDPNFATTVATELGKKANSSDLGNYLLKSGGTLTGELKTKQITIEAGSWLVSNGSGISLQRADGTSYIWNTASKSIAIGTNSVGQSNELNASLVINGTNIYPGTSNKFSLGTDSYKFKDIYGTNFWGTAQNATNDSSGNKIVDTYALASTCYGGPEGKFAIGNSDNLIGKALTGSWGIYNKYHDIVISEYDASTETWVEKFNSTTLTAGSANYNAFVKGEKGNFYTSTRGSKVKLTVTSNAGSVYVQAIGLYLKTKDATYNGNIDYSYWTNGGKTSYSGVSGTWGSWCNITMSGTYRTAFEIFFNEGGANAQIAINGFRIATQTDGIVPVLIGKSHESYKADAATTADTANRATIATRSAMVGDGTIQLYAQSGNEINFGGTNTNNPSIIFGYKSADGNQIVPTQYKFGKDATASVYASKFITTGGTASQVVLGDGTLKNLSDFSDTKVTQTERDSSNYAYPILLSESSTTGTRGVIFGSTPCINPVTHKILGIDYVQSDSSDIELIADEYVIINGTHLWPKTTNSIDIGGTNKRFKNAYFSGTVYAATSFMQSSDERLKDFGEGLEVDLDALSKLRKSYFTFKDKPEDLQIGISAQEIQKLYPEIVSETDNGYLNVDYSKLAVIALAAIDKLNEEIKELKKLINK